MRVFLFCLLSFLFAFVKGQENDTTWLKKGNDAFYKVKLGKAIDCYSKAIELNSKHTSAYYNRGLVKTQLDKYEEAIEDYTKVITLDSSNVNGYYKRADSYYRLKKYKEALKDYDKVIVLDPNNAQVYIDRAPSKLFLDDYAGYKADLQKAKEIEHPHKKIQQVRDTIWLYKANAAANFGNYGDAVDYYTESILLSDNDANTFFKRGIAYLNLHQYSNAIKDFRVAVLLDPTIELYKINLKLAIAEDSTYHESKQVRPTEREYVSQRFPDNRYSSFHQTIKDIAHKTVSDIGVYISAGIGGGNIHFKNGGYNPNGTGGAAALLSASLAYKSHLFTLTRAGATTIFQDVGPGQFIYTANYAGFLVGESIRFKHVMLSLSAGIAYANISVTENVNSYFVPYKEYDRISFPIELKAFVYARNGIGFGLHLSKSIDSAQFNPFYFGVCIVAGYWNQPKKIKE